MHRLRLILITALLAGCGGADAPERSAATPTPAPGVKLDLRRDADAWPGLPGGKLALGDPALVDAPEPIGPPSNVVAQLVLPASGRAGVFCGRYGVAVGADGRYGVYRLVEGKSPDEVLKGRVEKGGRSDPGEPWVVRLVCGERNGDDPVAIGFMINASPIAYAKDDDPSGTEDPGRVGALGIGSGEDARYLQFIASDTAG
jgi:hypothetical protein